MISDIVILGKSIPLYGIFFYLGIAVAALAALMIRKWRNFDGWEIVYSAIYVMIGAMIGSKLLFIIVSWQDIIKYDLDIVSVIKGGFVFYGGLIGGIAGLLIYNAIYKNRNAEYLDLFAVVLPLGHAFGRIGCFFAGCCYGIPCSFGVVYDADKIVGLTPTGVRLLPIQLIEALCLLFLFAGLLVIYKKAERAGICAVVYCFSYSAIRFVIEFFRGDGERGRLLGVSTSQWICIALAVSAAIITVILNKKEKQNEKN